jgi:hypothetical protein
MWSDREEVFPTPYSLEHLLNVTHLQVAESAVSEL